MMTDQDQLALPPAVIERNRIFTLFRHDGEDADVDAAVAALAGPGGIRPDDVTVVLRQFGGGPLPADRAQPRWRGEGDADAAEGGK